MVQIANRGLTVKQRSNGSFFVTAGVNEIMDMIAASENYPYDGVVYHSINGSYSSAEITRIGNDFEIEYRFDNSGLNYITVEFKLLNVETNAFEFQTEAGSDTIYFYVYSETMMSGNGINIPIYTNSVNQRVRLFLKDQNNNPIAEFVQNSGADKIAVFELNEVIHSWLGDLSRTPSYTGDGLVDGMDAVQLFICQAVIGNNEVVFSFDFHAVYGFVNREVYRQNLFNGYLSNNDWFDFRRASDAPSAKPAYYNVSEYIGVIIGPRVFDRNPTLDLSGTSLYGTGLGSSIALTPNEESEWSVRSVEVTVYDPSMVDYSLLLNLDDPSSLPTGALDERTLANRKLKTLPVTSHQPSYIVFLNKYGAWENFMFLGEIREQHQSTGQNVNLFINEDDPTANSVYPLEKKLERSYSLNSGEHDIEVIRWLSEELSQSRFVFIRVGVANFERIFTEAGKMAELRSAGNLASLEISFTTQISTPLIK